MKTRHPMSTDRLDSILGLILVAAFTVLPLWLAFASWGESARI